MDAVHWFSLAGLVWALTGFWALTRAHGEAQRAAAYRCLIRKQLEMISEAIELSRYGAWQEAEDLIDDAARLRPSWDARQEG